MERLTAEQALWQVRQQIMASRSFWETTIPNKKNERYAKGYADGVDAVLFVFDRTAKTIGVD